MQETLPKRVPYLSPHVTYPWRTSAKKGPSNRWIFSGWTVKSLPYYSTNTRCYIHLWTRKTGTRINSRWPFIPFHIFKLLTHHTPHAHPLRRIIQSYLARFSWALWICFLAFCYSLLSPFGFLSLFFFFSFFCLLAKHASSLATLRLPPDTLICLCPPDHIPSTKTRQ